jgi:hypothetical protein
MGIRLVSCSGAKMPADFELALEQSTNRLREALAILQVIEDGELLADVPDGEASERHKLAVSLLGVLARELNGVIAAQDNLI